MQLVDIDKITPSAYNPREADPQRLKYIEYSLRKLGFLLPLYVCKDTGEILSGHQRHYVSKQLGIKKVPVEFVDNMSLQRRKAYNIVFNRCTNDLSRDDTSETVKQKLEQYDLTSILSKLPDVLDSNDSKLLYPCLYTEILDGKELAKINIDKNDNYCKTLARNISKVAGYMPVIVNTKHEVINGIGRLFNQLEKGITNIKCIVLPDDKAQLAYLMLNYVSMDFNLEKKYTDDLRYNSFRRNMTLRGSLGRGFIVGVFGKGAKSKDYPALSGNNLNRFVKKYGKNIIDFGAGRLTDTAILRKAGLNVYPFEPYFCDSDTINFEKSRTIAKQFLKDVESGRPFDSIFISSVFNSVPFFADRLNIVAICAALCSSHTVLTIWAMSTKHNNFVAIGADGLNDRNANIQQFKLDYEQGVILGNLKDKPKVQKFHTKAELYELVKNFFDDVKIAECGDSILVECKHAKINLDKLCEALEFEFNLPYPDNKRMGLVDEAKKAFSKRLGVDLCKIK